MPKIECCVPLCTNQGGHTFPSAKVRASVRQQWIVAIQRADNESKHKMWEPKKPSVVCSDHFQPSDYHQETYYGMYLNHSVYQ